MQIISQRSKQLRNYKTVIITTRKRLFGTRRRAIISIIVLLLLLFAAWKVFGQSQTRPQYQTEKVTRGTIISSISESGNVSAGNQVSVTSPTNGIITNLYVKNGDEVSAGENLFEVKATATPQEQAAAYATYESSLNSLNNAQQGQQAMVATLEKDRQAILDAQNAVDQMNNNQTNPATKQGYTQNEKDSITSQLTSARETFSADETKYNQEGTAIAAAQASQNSAALSYQATQDSIVTSPIDGTVANLTASLGGNVSSSGNSSNASNSNASGTSSTSSTTNSSSSPVLEIANFSNLYVKVQASEVDVPNIKPGQKVTVTLDAFPGKTFVGSVTNVDTIGTASSGVVTYNVYISLDYAPPGVEPGMSASVSIQTARKDDVLMVPTTAVQTINGASYVRVIKNGKVIQTPVTTGISSDTDTEITSGLSEGDTVVTSVVLPTTGRTGTGATSPFSGLGGNRGFGGGGGGGTFFRTGGGGGGARGQ